MKLRKVENDNNTEVYRNISLEHSILDLSAESRNQITLRFWRNDPSVIIGRTQNLHEEVDLKFCEDNSISVLRRISGGGTVYHDHGNLNTSIFFPIKLLPGKPDVQKASKYMTKLMIQNLQNLGFSEIEQEGGTNIFYQGLKISGSAGHLRKGWFLHHATLLINSDIDTLNKTILARESHPDDPRKSRYFPTVNLENLKIKDWEDSFSQLFANRFELEIEPNDISNTELKFSKKLVENLYKDKKWLVDGKRVLVKPD